MLGSDKKNFELIEFLIDVFVTTGENVVITGLMGAGKSTMTRRIMHEMGCDATLSFGEVCCKQDTAKLLVVITNNDGTVLFEKHGEDLAWLHSLKEDVLSMSKYNSAGKVLCDLLDVIKFNIHMVNVDGERRIDYIAEIVGKGNDLPLRAEHLDEEDICIETRYLVKYDSETDSYVTGDWFNRWTEKEIKSKLGDSSVVTLDNYKATYWR